MEVGAGEYVGALVVGCIVGAGVEVGPGVDVGANVAVGAAVAVGAGVANCQLVLKTYVLFGGNTGLSESGGGTMVTFSQTLPASNDYTRGYDVLF